MSDLRYHRTCPTQSFLRGLHLPMQDEYSTEAKLGQAVHAYLETLHRRAGHPPCTVDDLPARGKPWTTGRWRVPAETEEVGRRMLENHLDWCPFQDTALISRVEPEQSLTFHDTAAQAVVFAKPDLLTLEDGSWVWRELKTTQKPHFRRADPLEQYPQLALAVLLLERGALGGDAAGSRIELELLRPEYGDVLLVDPTDPERIGKAREVIRGYAGPWRADDTFEARPGRHCQWCPVSLWCPSSAAG